MRTQKIIELISKNLFLEAKIECKNLLHIYPKDHHALYLLGTLCLKEKNFNEAVDLINKSINLNSKNYAAFNNLGSCYASLKKNDEALINYNKAIKLKPDYAEAYNNRGVVLKSLGRIDEAIESYNKAIELRPNYIDAYHNKGIAFQSIFNFEESLKNYNQTISLKPDYAEAYNNRGVVLKSLGRIDEAIESYNKAIELNPNYADPINNLGFIFQLKKDYKKGLVYFNKALELDPDSENKKFTIGLLNLKFQKFKEGWTGYEWRKNLKDRDVKLKKYDSFPLPKLNELKDKKILIYSEQGLGDIILFSRYIKLLSKITKKITFKTYNSLIELFKTFNNCCEITNLELDTQDFDYTCSLLSLPLIFETNEENIPKEMMNLSINEEKSIFWEKKLKNNNFRIGIAWIPNLENKDMADRVLELNFFNKISKIKNIELISLQKNFIPNEADKATNVTYFENLDKGPNAFSDSICIIKNIDLIISIDTSVAHLAATLKKPTWIILKADADWRWFLNSDKTQWYSSAKLFRQDQINNWDQVSSNIERELNKLIK